MRRQSWVLVALGALTAIGGCDTRVAQYERQPAAEAAGAQGGSAGGQAQDGSLIWRADIPSGAQCRSAVVTHADSRQGLPCSTGASDACQWCLCIDGVQQCSQHNCSTSGCPPRLPPSGEPCTGEPCECVYDSGCGEPHRARCDGGRWRVRPATCAAPCPETLPEAGSDCWHPGLRCDYGDSCAPILAFCGAPHWTEINGPLQNTWQLVEPSPTSCPDPLCPEHPPEPGSLCQPDRSPCWLEDPAEDCQEEVSSCHWINDCGGQVHGNCDRDGWHVVDEGCANNSLCPTEPPHTGDPCDQPLPIGPMCSYEDGGDCAPSCLCMSDRKWACYQVCSQSSERPYTAQPYPGTVPGPGSICEQWGWCRGLGATCRRGSLQCNCTAEGWRCQVQRQ